MASGTFRGRRDGAEAEGATTNGANHRRSPSVCQECAEKDFQWKLVARNFWLNGIVARMSRFQIKILLFLPIAPKHQTERLLHCVLGLGASETDQERSNVGLTGRSVVAAA